MKTRLLDRFLAFFARRSEQPNSPPTKQQPTPIPVSEWTAILRSASRDELKRRLGLPYLTCYSDREWVYRRLVIDPLTERRSDLVITFNEGGLVDTFRSGIGEGGDN